MHSVSVGFCNGEQKINRVESRGKLPAITYFGDVGSLALGIGLSGVVRSRAFAGFNKPTSGEFCTWFFREFCLVRRPLGSRHSRNCPKVEWRLCSSSPTFTFTPPRFWRLVAHWQTAAQVSSRNGPIMTPQPISKDELALEA